MKIFYLLKHYMKNVYGCKDSIKDCSLTCKPDSTLLDKVVHLKSMREGVTKSWESEFGIILNLNCIE
jgi:hypothetical protein